MAVTLAVTHHIPRYSSENPTARATHVEEIPAPVSPQIASTMTRSRSTADPASLLDRLGRTAAQRPTPLAGELTVRWSLGNILPQLVRRVQTRLAIHPEWN